MPIAKNTHFFFTFGCVCINDIYTYIAWAWKITLITCFVLRRWYPPWNTSPPTDHMHHQTEKNTQMLPYIPWHLWSLYSAIHITRSVADSVPCRWTPGRGGHDADRKSIVLFIGLEQKKSIQLHTPVLQCMHWTESGCPLLSPLVQLHFYNWKKMNLL